MATTIPLVDLRRQYNELREEIDGAIAGIVESGSFIQGRNVESLEREFGGYLGVKHAIGVGSGTDALRLAIEALKTMPLDEVITVGHTFVSTVYAIVQNGCRPVLVDVNARTGTMETSLVRKAVTKKTKVIIPVHIYGQPADMAELMELADRENLTVVEDAAQAHGAEYHGRKAGAIGRVGCFSFYPSKNLGAYGDGGMVVTDSDEIAERIALLREYGQKSKYHFLTLGYNSRLDEIQAAILRVKLKYLDKWNNQRRGHAKLYNEIFERLGSRIELPYESRDRKHVYHLYVIRSERRDELRQHLSANGISSGVHYPVPVHKQPVFARISAPIPSLPVTEKMSHEVLSLPMFPELQDDEIERIANTVNLFRT